MAKIKAMPIVIGAAALGGGYLLYKRTQTAETETPGGGGSSIFSPDFSFLSDLYTGSSGTMQDAFNALAGAFSTQGELFSGIVGNVRDFSESVNPFDAITQYIDDQKTDAAEWWDQQKEGAEALVDKVTGIPADITNNAATAVTNAIDNAKTSAQNQISNATGGLGAGRTALAVAGGWGTLGAISGTVPPFIPFAIVGALAALGGAKLRQKGITRDIAGGVETVAPETAIADWIKKLGSTIASGLKDTPTPASAAMDAVIKTVNAAKNTAAKVIDLRGASGAGKPSTASPSVYSGPLPTNLSPVNIVDRIKMPTPSIFPTGRMGPTAPAPSLPFALGGTNFTTFRLPEAQNTNV